MEPNNFNNEQNSQPMSAASAEMDAVLSATPQPQPEPNMMQAPAPKKKTNWMMILTILFAVLATGGIGFGAWAMMDGNTTVDKLEKQIVDLKAQNSTLLDQVAEAGDDTVIDIDVNSNTPAVDTEDYIYVGEWGLKIKKIESLNQIKYKFVSTYVSGLKFEIESLCVTGVYDTEGMYAFNNIDDGAYVCLSQNFGSGAGVYSDEVKESQYPEGEFYVQGPQAVYSTDEEDKKVETESVRVIKEWLSNADYRSKI